MRSASPATKRGELVAVYDSWDGNLRPVIGESVGLLKQAYVPERAKITTRRQNHCVEEIAHPGGAIKFVATEKTLL